MKDRYCNELVKIKEKKPKIIHQHLWAVRDRTKEFTRYGKLQEDGSIPTVTMPGYTIYFCQKCLEVKKVSDE